MTRRTFDWVLIVLLTVSWGLLFARAVSDGLRAQRGWLAISVSAAATSDSYPTVVGGDEAQGLGPGDALVAVEGESLRGASALRFYDLAMRAVRERGSVSISAISRAGSPIAARLELRSTKFWWTTVLIFSALVLTGVILLARAPDWHLARRTAIACWCFGAGRLAAWGFGPVAGTAGEITLYYLGWGVGSVLTVWNVQDFTRSAQPVPRWQRTFALAPGALFGISYVTRYFVASAPGIGFRWVFVASVGSLAVGTLAGMTRAYVRSKPLERRQIRWVVLGFYVAMVGAGLGPLTMAISPALTVPTAILVSTSLLCIPLGMLISVVGFRWLDIDRLISATAAYTIAGVLALGAAFAVVPRLASAGGPALGLDPVTAQWLINLALAGAAAFGAHRYLRPPLDRRIFAERHRRVSELEQLVEDVGRCAGAEELWTLAAERIDALLEPESLVAYDRDGKLFQPRFSRGRVKPPPYPADSLLVRALERRGLPLAADSSALDAFDRAALETLGVALVVPIGTHQSLLGFACLGPKRSGDIYTREETAQLAAIALRCAQVLRPVPEPSAPPVSVFRHEGDLWTLSHGGKEVRLRDMRGLHYLAVLLREPGREFAVADLVAAVSGHLGSGVQHPELRTARGLGDAGPVLDAQARAAYRRRVTSIDEELADAERCADLGRLERASFEREALLAELESAARGKRAGSDSERARTAVTKAIKLALEKIAERHPELGAHLSATVRRGYACAYEPDPRVPIEWEV